MSAWAIPFLTVVVLASLEPASSAERLRCLSRNEQRAAISDGKAMPLAAVRQRLSGELVRARLCQEPERLVYQLTLLPRDGKVRRMIIDATNGTVVSER